MGDVWKAKDGREIPMAEMGESHLIHALAWAERNGLKKRLKMAKREYGRRFCLLHEDCRAHRELGRACMAMQSNSEEKT